MYVVVESGRNVPWNEHEDKLLAILDAITLAEKNPGISYDVLDSNGNVVIMAYSEEGCVSVRDFEGKKIRDLDPSKFDRNSRSSRGKRMPNKKDHARKGSR